MLAFIQGTILDIRQRSVIVENGGLGYEVSVPARVLGQAVTRQEISLWLRSVTRDQGTELYGFVDADAIAVFDLLVAVSGVGPRSALGIIDALPLAQLVGAVQTGDSALFATVSGIGKKTSQKIVLELTGKVDALTSELSASSQDSADLIAALESLGYSSEDIREALRSMPEELTDLQDKISFALRYLGGSS